jgi:hypothetical protein
MHQTTFQNNQNLPDLGSDLTMTAQGKGVAHKDAEALAKVLSPYIDRPSCIMYAHEPRNVLTKDDKAFLLLRLTQAMIGDVKEALDTTTCAPLTWSTALQLINKDS